MNAKDKQNDPKRNSYIVRAAFYLNLDSVLFTSAAEEGKESGTVGPDALTTTGTTINDDWKLTIRDDARQSFNAETVSCFDGNSIVVKYSGATTGSNEYISAILQRDSGTVKSYGRFAQPSSESGTVTINFTEKPAVTDKLYIFNEQYNGDKKTDYSSDLIGIPIGSHTLVKHNAVAPTYTEDGHTAYWKCSVCEKAFADKNGIAEIDEEDTVIKALGQNGVGIVSITKTATNGNVDTYTITYSNNTTSTFTVTNGDKGDTGEKGDKGDTGEKGDKGDTGKDGKNGVSIVKIKKTGAKGNVNTYTVYMSDGTTSTFTVTNGIDKHSLDTPSIRTVECPNGKMLVEWKK